jgi:hypothetical protein
VIAGIRKRKTNGARINSPSIFAYPKSRILNCIGTTHRNSPITTKKTMITIYPIREFKKPLTSFLNKAYISVID